MIEAFSRRLRSTGGDKAKDGADKDTYQSDTDAVDGPSQNSTRHAEDNPESVFLLVSTLICVTPRANLAVERDVFPAVRAAHQSLPHGQKLTTAAATSSTDWILLT
jgi:hypothetical protein